MNGPALTVNGHVFSVNGPVFSVNGPVLTRERTRSSPVGGVSVRHGSCDILGGGTAAMPDFRREDAMRFAIAALAALTLLGCSALKPLPIRGGDTCFACGKVIAEPKLAAQIIDAGGRAYKFENVTCLAKYLVNHPSEQPAGTFVTDWSTGKWLPAADATYVRAVVDESNLAKSYYAFRSAPTAADFAKEKASAAIDWPAVQRQVKGN